MNVNVKPYSVQAEGNANVSKNFKVREFKCNDGTDVVFLSPELVKILQKVRERFKRPVTVTSGFRTPAYNKKVGGVENSQHLYGLASDIVVQGVSPITVASYIETLMPNTGGIGLYDTFVHVDVRKNKSRWQG